MCMLSSEFLFSCKSLRRCSLQVRRGRVRLQLSDSSGQQLLQSVRTQSSSTVCTEEIWICIRRWPTIKGSDHLFESLSSDITTWIHLPTDYQMVLKLDPGNAEAQNEVKKIQEVSVKWSFWGSASFLVFSFTHALLCDLVSDPWRSNPGRPEWSHAVTGGSHSRARAGEADGGAAETAGGGYTERQSKLHSGFWIILQCLSWTHQLTCQRLSMSHVVGEPTNSVNTKCAVLVLYPSGERLFQRGEVRSSCRVLQQRHGGRQHERPAARQQSHGFPQAGEVSTSFIPPARFFFSCRSVNACVKGS